MSNVEGIRKKILVLYWKGQMWGTLFDSRNLDMQKH
jgi:hypothetical protein